MGGAQRSFIQGISPCIPTVTVSPANRMSQQFSSPIFSGRHQIHNFLDLGRKSTLFQLKVGIRTFNNYIDQLPKFGSLKFRIEKVYFSKVHHKQILLSPKPLGFSFQIIFKPPWTHFITLAKLYHRLPRGTSRLSWNSQHLSVTAFNSTLLDLHFFHCHKTEFKFKITQWRLIPIQLRMRWTGKLCIYYKQFVNLLISTLHSFSETWKYLHYPALTSSIIMNSEHLQQSTSSVGATSWTYQSPTSGKRKSAQLDPPSANPGDGSSFSRPIHIMNTALQQPIAYPTETAILSIFHDEDKNPRFEQLFSNLQEIMINRQERLRLPPEFTDAANKVHHLLTTDVMVTTARKYSLLGLLWSIIRSVSEQLRQELLQAEYQQMTSLPRHLDLSSKFTKTLNRRLEVLYDEITNSTIESFREMQASLTREFPADVQHWARSEVHLTGDDLVTKVPQFLATQISAVLDDQDCSPFHQQTDTVSAWTTPNVPKVLFGSTAQKTGKATIWEQTTTSGKGKHHDRLLPVTPVEREPEPIRAADLATLQRHVLATRVGRSYPVDSDTMPPELRDYQTIFHYEESIEVTRFVLVLNFQSVTDLETPEANLSQTIAEAQYIVRSIGFLSEHLPALKNTGQFDNGLFLDDVFMKANMHRLLLDPDDVGNFQSVILVLKDHGRFGSATAPATSTHPMILPLCQRITRKTSTTDTRTWHTYMVQAIPEWIKPELLPSRHHEAVVCRGIPDSNHSLPVTAACIKALHDWVISNSVQTKILDNAPDVPKKFAITLGYVKHRLIEVKSKGEETVTTYLTKSSWDAMHRKTRASQQKSKSKSRTAPTFTTVNELVVRAMWLGDLFDKDLTLLHFLRNEFKKQPVIPFYTMGLNLEILSTREACLTFPSHLPITDTHVYHTAITNMRPHLSSRQLLHFLLGDPATKHMMDSLLHAAFILPEIQTKKGVTHHWTALFVWANYCTGVAPTVCQPLAARNVLNQPLTLSRVNLSLTTAVVEGLRRFRSLGQAYGTRDYTLKASRGNRNSSTAGKISLSPDDVRNTLPPLPQSTGLSPYPKQSQPVDFVPTWSPLQFPPRPPVQDQLGDTATSQDLNDSVNMDEDPDDSESLHSEYTPSINSEEIKEKIERAVSDATKCLEDQLRIQQTTNDALVAQLQSLTASTDNTIAAMRAEAKTDRLHTQAQGQAAYLQRLTDTRSALLSDIEILTAEADDLTKDGTPLPRTLTTKHDRFQKQLSTTLAQIEPALSGLQDICKQLGVNTSHYFHEE
jgi:hypothetical protein